MFCFPINIIRREYRPSEQSFIRWVGTRIHSKVKYIWNDQNLVHIRLTARDPGASVPKSPSPHPPRIPDLQEVIGQFKNWQVIVIVVIVHIIDLEL